MEAVTIDDRALSPLHVVEGEIKARSQEAPVGILTVGPLERTRELISCTMMVPNFADEAAIEGGGVRITLKEVSPKATRDLYASESQGKVLPGTYLEVQRLKEDAGENVGLAVDDLGWLLSFYTGRRIHPIAWEGETNLGPVWQIQNTRLVTPLNDNYVASCISRVVPLEHFLQHAWRAWENHSEERRARLRGAINFYADMLSATFPTQSLAFTTMYLERFRELFVGDSELLGGSKSRKKKIASELREALRESIASSQKLSDSEKDTLHESLRRNPGKVNDLFRKSFRESLLELCDMFDLNVDEKELGEFIEQRDTVLHGSWDSGPGGTLETYRLAQYSLNLLEMLLLRLFEYEGKHFNRVDLSTQDFPPGTANRQ
jgi:hypothetical protein